jgi:hypothetical protein
MLIIKFFPPCSLVNIYRIQGKQAVAIINRGEVFLINSGEMLAKDNLAQRGKDADTRRF